MRGRIFVCMSAWVRVCVFFVYVMSMCIRIYFCLHAFLSVCMYVISARIWFVYAFAGWFYMVVSDITDTFKKNLNTNLKTI